MSLHMTVLIAAIALLITSYLIVPLWNSTVGSFSTALTA